MIKAAKEKGYTISRFSGLRLFVPSINAPDDFVRAKEERVVGNFAIQSGNFLMLRAINKMQNWIEQNNLIEQVKIINTVHDSVYLYIRKDAELIAKVNKVLIGFMTEPYAENLAVPLEAELDIGNNMAAFVTLKNDASIQDIEQELQNLEKETA